MQKDPLWQLLPADMRRYILSFMNISTLFAVSKVSRSQSAVIKDFLEHIPTPKLLSLLPLWDGERTEAEQRLPCRPLECVGYRAARLEMLHFQMLVRNLKLSQRWWNFNTMEDGILTMITVPREELDDDQLRRLVFGDSKEGGVKKTTSEIPSAHLEAEIKRLGVERVAEIVKILAENIQHHREQKVEVMSIITFYSEEYLKVLAVMILRATKDPELQKFLIQLHGSDWSKLGEPLLAMYQCAKLNDNQRVIDVIGWLIEKDGAQIEESLKNMIEKNPDPHQTYILHRLIYLEALPGCIDEPLPLPKEPINYREVIPMARGSWNSISENYTLWSCALLLGSFEKAANLLKSLLWRYLLTIDRRFARGQLMSYPDNPLVESFGNYSVTTLNPRSIRKGSHFCDDFYQATFEKVTPPNYEPTHFEALQFDNCMMNQVILSNQEFQKCGFTNMKIDYLVSENAIFRECDFFNIGLENSRFDNARLVSTTFRQCDFSSRVSFKMCEFMKLNERPVIFEGCKLTAKSLVAIKNINNAIFINCEFFHGEKLPAGIICYETKNKDINSIEGAYELFKLLEPKKENYRILELQQALMGKLRILKGNENGDISAEQDGLCRKIFGHEFSLGKKILNKLKGEIPQALREYEGLNIGVVSHLKNFE